MDLICSTTESGISRIPLEVRNQVPKGLHIPVIKKQDITHLLMMFHNVQEMFNSLECLQSDVTVRQNKQNMNIDMGMRTRLTLYIIKTKTNNLKNTRNNHLLVKKVY